MAPAVVRVLVVRGPVEMMEEGRARARRRSDMLRVGCGWCGGCADGGGDGVRFGAWRGRLDWVSVGVVGWRHGLTRVLGRREGRGFGDGEDKALRIGRVSVA